MHIYFYTHFALTFTIMSQSSQKKMGLSRPLHPISRLSHLKQKRALLVVKPPKWSRKRLLNRLLKRLLSNPPYPQRPKSPNAPNPMVRRRLCFRSKVSWRRRSRGHVQPVWCRRIVVAREAVVHPWNTRVCGR